jgi:hypothetical protein
MRQGIHTKSYPNGATFTGHYLDDKRHGFGLKVHADGVTIKFCCYKNGIKTNLGCLDNKRLIFSIKPRNLI